MAKPFHDVKVRSPGYRVAQIKAFVLPTGVTKGSSTCGGEWPNGRCLLYKKYQSDPDLEPDLTFREMRTIPPRYFQSPDWFHFQFPAVFRKPPGQYNKKHKLEKTFCGKERVTYRVSSLAGEELALIHLPTLFSGECRDYEIGLFKAENRRLLISFEPKPGLLISERVIFGYLELAPQ